MRKELVIGSSWWVLVLVLWRVVASVSGVGLCMGCGRTRLDVGGGGGGARGWMYLYLC